MLLECILTVNEFKERRKMGKKVKNLSKPQTAIFCRELYIVLMGREKRNLSIRQNHLSYNYK